jgi:hypothetical protein
LEILLSLPVKSPKLVKVFIEASGNVKVLFLTIKTREKLKTICAHTESTDIDIQAFNKKIYLMTKSRSQASFWGTNMARRVNNNIIFPLPLKPFFSLFRQLAVVKKFTLVINIIFWKLLTCINKLDSTQSKFVCYEFPITCGQ